MLFDQIASNLAPDYQETEPRAVGLIGERPSGCLTVGVEPNPASKPASGIEPETS